MSRLSRCAYCKKRLLAGLAYKRKNEWYCVKCFKERLVKDESVSRDELQQVDILDYDDSYDEEEVERAKEELRRWLS